MTTLDLTFVMITASVSAVCILCYVVAALVMWFIGRGKTTSGGTDG